MDENNLYNTQNQNMTGNPNMTNNPNIAGNPNMTNNPNMAYNPNMAQPPRAVVYDTMPVKSNMAIAGLIISLFALFFSWTITIGLVLGLLGLACSIVSLCKKEKSRGMAIAGLIISIISIIFAILAGMIIYILTLA